MGGKRLQARDHTSITMKGHPQVSHLILGGVATVSLAYCMLGRRLVSSVGGTSATSLDTRKQKLADAERKFASMFPKVYARAGKTVVMGWQGGRGSQGGSGDGGRSHHQMCGRKHRVKHVTSSIQQEAHLQGSPAWQGRRRSRLADRAGRNAGPLSHTIMSLQVACLLRFPVAPPVAKL